jgi:hypothetical protein
MTITTLENVYNRIILCSSEERKKVFRLTLVMGIGFLINVFLLCLYYEASSFPAATFVREALSSSLLLCIWTDGRDAMFFVVYE